MANVLTLETNKYEIKLENFAGPLDLLCHLIDKNKLDIYEVKISDITDQYIEYINQMEQSNLEITSEFLLMASTLVYIKSKGLLPKNNEDEEEEITEEELLKRVVEYKQYKEISQLFREKYNLYSNRIYKLPETITLPKQNLEKEYDYNLLVEYYKNIRNRNDVKVNLNLKENMEKISISESVTITSKVKLIFKELLKKNKFVFNKLFSKKDNRPVDIVTAFLGLLEMSRKDRVTVQQEKNFGDIIVSKKEKNK